MGEHGLTFDLRIDLSVDGNPAHDVHSRNVVTALVNNVGPVATLDIDLGTGVQCRLQHRSRFTGAFDATDDYFGSFSFEIQPSGPAHGILPVPPRVPRPALGGAIGILGERRYLHLDDRRAARPARSPWTRAATH